MGGVFSIMKSEQNLFDTTKRILFHGEKDVAYWKELVHHFNAKRAVVASGGAGPLLFAFLQMGVKSLILCKNDDHKNLLENELRGFLMLDCQTNREVDYYLPDFDIDMALGLDATGLTVPAAPQSSSARLEASPAAAATAAAGEGVDESDSDEFEEGFEEQPAATDPVHPSVDDEL